MERERNKLAFSLGQDKPFNITVFFSFICPCLQQSLTLLLHSANVFKGFLYPSNIIAMGERKKRREINSRPDFLEFWSNCWSLLEFSIHRIASSYITVAIQSI